MQYSNAIECFEAPVKDNKIVEHYGGGHGGGGGGGHGGGHGGGWGGHGGHGGGRGGWGGRGWGHGYRRYGGGYGGGYYDGYYWPWWYSDSSYYGYPAYDMTNYNDPGILYTNDYNEPGMVNDYNMVPNNQQLGSLNQQYAGPEMRREGFGSSDNITKFLLLLVLLVILGCLFMNR
jgi:hypothetical protein